MQADDAVDVDGSLAENSTPDIHPELISIKEKLCWLYKRLTDISKFRLPTLQSVPYILSAAVLTTDMCGYKIEQLNFTPHMHIPPWKFGLCLNSRTYKQTYEG